MTLPVTTATIETSFSVMKYLKDELRNRMGDQWTNNCLVVYNERDVACNICKVVIYNYVLCWLYSMCCNCFNLFSCILWDCVVLDLVLRW